LESSWHLLTNLISAVISLPELNSQENKPSELAVVPSDIIMKINIKRILVPCISNKIGNAKNHSIFLTQSKDKNTCLCSCFFAKSGVSNL